MSQFIILTLWIIMHIYFTKIINFTIILINFNYFILTILLHKDNAKNLIINR